MKKMIKEEIGHVVIEETKPDYVTEFELRIPSRTESLLAISTGKLAEAKWIKIF